MSISLQGYLDRISSLGMVQLPGQGDNQTLINSQPQSSDKDSYIPSMTTVNDVMPSGSYNSSGMIKDSLNRAQGISSIDSPTETSAVMNSQGSSSSLSSTEDDDIQIQTVTINGMQYREITRTENGVEITTRELIGEE